MSLADPLNIRQSILDNLRHNPDGLSKTRLAGLVERDTGAALEAILDVYADLERRGELYEYEYGAGEGTTVKESPSLNR